jgi:hypothetical protein
MSNSILNKAKDTFIQEQVEDSFNDYKFIMSVLYEYFKNEVNKMSEKEFKDYLENELGYSDEMISNLFKLEAVQS